MSNIQSCQLGDLIEFQRGFDLPKSEFVEGSYPVQSSNGILGFHNEYKVKAPGITIGRSGTVGIPHLLEIDFFPHNTALFIKDFKGNNVKYIYYLLKHLRLNDRKSGSGVPTMNRNHLHPLKINAFTNKDVQKKIANVLAALDKKIELNNRINTELEAMAKTLYDYWLVQFDFPDANGKPYKTSGGKMVYNEDLNREIPEGWEAKMLSNITSVSTKQLTPSSTPNVKFKHYSIPVFDASGTYGLEKGGTIGSDKFTVQVNDLLISKLNPWFNRVVYSMDDDAICSTEFVVWRTPNNPIKNFLYMLATSDYFIQHCTQSATGTSNSHKRVSPTIMMRMKVAFDDAVATKLGERLAPLIQKIMINKKENKELAQLRDWLLPMLMNGQVTVSSPANSN